MGANREPEYACPHIDAVLDPLKELIADLPRDWLQWKVADIEAVFDGLDLLKAKAEYELEKVRSICEELRADRNQFESDCDDYNEEIGSLKDRIEVLERELEQALETISKLESD